MLNSQYTIEIISLPLGQTRVVKGKFIKPRFAFGMVTVGGRFPRVLAIGGGDGCIEIWDEKNEKWSLSPYKMEINRSEFGYLAVPESVICNESSKR